jgi:hypothetical protein
MQLKGHSAAEREIVLQRLMSEARQAGIEDVAKYTDVLRGYAEQLNKIQEQQNSPGGLLGGLRDLKGELPSLQEHLYEVGRAMREGIAQSLTDAVFEARNLGDALKNVAKNFAKMIFEYQMQRAVAGMFGATGFARGGIVPAAPQLVYAASGAFIPRGTDTVPAMLTPGEAVIDRGTTTRLKQILGGGGSGGGSTTFTPPPVNVSFINQSSTEVGASIQSSKFDGDKFVVEAILRDKHRNGPTARHMGRR